MSRKAGDKFNIGDAFLVAFQRPYLQHKHLMSDRKHLVKSLGGGEGFQLKAGGERFQLKAFGVERGSSSKPWGWRGVPVQSLWGGEGFQFKAFGVERGSS